MTKGAFADVVVNGDIHQQNADRVGCSRNVKSRQLRMRLSMVRATRS